MATINVGGIEVKIGANVTDLRNKLRQGVNALNDFANKGNRAFDGLSLRGIAAAVGISLSFGKLIDTIRQTINAADDLGKAAEKLGVGVQVLQNWKLAADKVDVSMETLSNSLRILTQKMQDEGNARMFSILGVSIRDATGNMRNTIDVLSDLADKMSTFRDSTDKTNIALMLFGRQGNELLPLLNMGSRGIQDIANAARDAGVAMNDNLLKAAKLFNDRWKEISDSFQKLANQVTLQLLPTLFSLEAAMDALLKSSAFLKTAVNGIVVVLKTAASAALVLAEGVGETAVAVVALRDSMNQLKSLDFSGAWSTMRNAFRQHEDSFNQMKAIIHKIWTDDIPSDVLEGNKKINDILKGTFNPHQVDPGANMKDAPHIPSAAEIARQAQLIRENSKGLESELAELGKLFGINTDKINENTLAWQQYNDAANAAVAAAQEAKQSNLADFLDTQGISTAEEKMQALNQAVREGSIGWRQYLQMSKYVTDQQEQNMNQVLSATASTLTQVFSKSKTAAIAAALINTYQGITAALKVDPPYGFVLAGLVAAQGFAQVANIRNTSMGGGGGSSAAPATAAPAAPAAPDQTLHVVGISSSQMFSGDAVRDLAQRLIDFQKDGGKVVLE